MSKTYIVSAMAFDPGFTTGWAFGGLTRPRHVELEEAGAIAWTARFTQIPKLLDKYNPDYIIAEDFRLYKHAATAQINSYFPSVRVIGILEFLAFQRSKGVMLQPAALRMSVKIPEEATSMLTSEHAADAYRHLRYFLITH